MREGALTSFMLLDPYRSLAGTSSLPSRSHVEYLLSDKIVMLIWHFNLVNKCNLTDML